MSDRLDLRTLREWGRLYSNRSRFGAEDEDGTLNFITPDRVLAAANLVRSGRVISCALPCDSRAAAAIGPRHGPLHDGALARPESPPSAPGPGWDSLARVSYGGFAYNDRPITQPAPEGPGPAALDRLASGLVGRGVLLDLPGHHRLPWLENGTRIGPDALDACAEASGVAIESGDILLIRTGRMTRGFAEGAWQGYAGGPAPGLSLRCARWLYERQVAAIATDTWCVEVVPHEVAYASMPFHQLAVRDMGLHLGECFHLDPLAEACAQDGHHAFLFAAAPAPTEAGGGALNPVAIK